MYQQAISRVLHTVNAIYRTIVAVRRRAVIASYRFLGDMTYVRVACSALWRLSVSPSVRPSVHEIRLKFINDNCSPKAGLKIK